MAHLLRIGLKQRAAGKPRRRARGEVMGPVADDPRARQIELHAVCGLDDHARIGFAPGVVVDPQRRLAIGMISAGQDAIEMSAIGRQCRLQCALHGMKGVPAVIAAADAGLIGHHDDRDLQRIAAGDRSGRARVHAHVFDAAEVMRIGDDDAVAVEEQRGAAGRHRGIDFAPQAGIFAGHGDGTSER
jgi:hypothetical protein